MRIGIGGRCVLVIALAALVGGLAASSALAEPWFAGNSRDPGYGVKASISTPSSTPSVSSGVVANRVSNQDGANWIQTGWVQGDGVSRAPDGTYWPTAPYSYEEGRVNGYYDLYLFSSQPLSFVRSYEVVHTGSGTWQAIVASTPRYYFGPFSTPTVVNAMTEIRGSTQPQTRAEFGGVQYKGLYSYMAFNQDNRRQDSPPYATFNSNSSYTCYSGM
jgi:hypothetical protein